MGLSAGVKAEAGMATLKTACTTFQDLISYFGEMLVFRSTLLGMPQCTSVYVYNDSLLDFIVKNITSFIKTTGVCQTSYRDSREVQGKK